MYQKAINVSLLVGLLFISFILKQCSVAEKDPAISTYERMKQGFIKPSGDARPKVYWWCLNGNIDTVRAKQELLAMKEAGIGGFDLFEIGAPEQDVMIPGGPAFLSDESLQIIKYLIEEAGKLDLTVGLNLASSWNAGGSWTKAKHGGKSLYLSTSAIRGSDSVQKLKIPFPEVSFPKESLIGGTGKPMIPFQENGRPEYYEEVAILALPSNKGDYPLDTSQIINVSGFFDPNKDLLEWEVPEGEWQIHRYICSNSGQQLVLPSPFSAGLTIDHFDAEAVEAHLMYVINRLQSVLGDFRETALSNFYLASYEARGFVWTSTLAEKFEKLHGYEITKLIPAFYDASIFPAGISEKVQADFRKTLSELMINNLYKNAKNICNAYGLKINCEAGGPGFPLYNGPAEPLKALGALDIPRGEFWINHARYYHDSKINDSIDILMVVKEVAAASHIYEKKIVEEEAFTSFQHWQEGPFDMKPFGDRAFCEGMNRVVFHGFSHNISGSGYPGYVYHAGTHFNDKRVWWPRAKPFIQYLSRLSSVFQEADFFADVVWYYGDKVPNSASPKNTHFTVGAGYDYEVINTEILLNDLMVKNGKLALPNGSEFSILVLEDEGSINPLVLVKLEELIKQGAKIVGVNPERITEIPKPPISIEEAELLINQLWDDDYTEQVHSDVTALELLKALQIGPDFDYADKNSFLLDFIHYEKEGLHFYYVSNTSDKWVSRACAFRLQNKVPEIWDPLTGEIIPVSVYDQGAGNIVLPLTLAPYGSQLIVFRQADPLPHYSEISSDKEHPPLLKFTKDGFQLLENGTSTLRDESKSKVINNIIQTQTLDGDWELFFPPNWGAPEKMELSELSSWTNSDVEGVKYFSGTATYRLTFQYDTASFPTGNREINLDLGDLSKVGEVWLNGKHLGISWSKPYRFDITDIIKSEENNLTIEVANTWSNRLTGDAITGENYTNSNIKRTIIPVEGMVPGDQSRIPWADVPLIESGLFGPVKLESIVSWKVDTVN